MIKFVVPVPIDPDTRYTDKVDTTVTPHVVTRTSREQMSYIEEEYTEEEISKHEINIYLKRKAVIDANIQKVYSLVMGQCTYLIKNKLKGINNWHTTKAAQDVLGLLMEINNITLQFEDQKYPVLSIHNAKVTFYLFRHKDLPNAVYLKSLKTWWILPPH